MIRALLTITLGFLLTSCSLFHVTQLEVQQGNVIRPAMVNKLHPGMSEAQVRDIMGNPILLNVFTPGRIEYVYTYQLGNHPREQKRVICIFANGKLAEVKKMI